MLQRLPEWIFIGAEVEGFVLEDAVEFRLGDAVDVGEKFFGLRLPMFAQRGDGLNRGVIGNRVRRVTQETFEPDPFATADVDQGVADGRETGAEWFGELV